MRCVCVSASQQSVLVSVVTHCLCSNALQGFLCFSGVFLLYSAKLWPSETKQRHTSERKVCVLSHTPLPQSYTLCLYECELGSGAKSSDRCHSVWWLTVKFTWKPHEGRRRLSVLMFQIRWTHMQLRKEPRSSTKFKGEDFNPVTEERSKSRKQFKSGVGIRTMLVPERFLKNTVRSSSQSEVMTSVYLGFIL